VGQYLIERGPQHDLMFDGKITHCFRLKRDAARETHRRAEVARRVHQCFTPPTQADDCGVQHLRAQLYAAAGAPGCLSGLARANASILAQFAAIRAKVGNGARSTLKKLAPAAWLATQISAIVTCSPWQ